VYIDLIVYFVRSEIRNNTRYLLYELRRQYNYGILLSPHNLTKVGGRKHEKKIGLTEINKGVSFDLMNNYLKRDF